MKALRPAFDVATESHVRIAHRPLGAWLYLVDPSLIPQVDPEMRKRPLYGRRIAVKDNIAVAGMPMTCGSRLLEGYRPPVDATVVARLRAAGGVVVGKTNMDEFAMGSTGSLSAFGPVLHPHDVRLSPGGSSSGSAVAIAAGHVELALGSDTGGSARLPAACCGIVALRPSPSRVSRSGLVAHASSLDQVAPMGRSCTGVEALFRAIQGADPLDATTSEPPEVHALTSVRVGTDGRGARGLHVDEPMLQAEQRLSQRARLEVSPAKTMSLPNPEDELAVYHMIAAAEAFSNLARFDGIRFGVGARPPETLRGALFGAEVKRRIVLGAQLLGSDSRSTGYDRALELRHEYAIAWRRALSTVEVIMTPALPGPPPRAGQEPTYDLDRLLVGPALAGLPALCVPVGGGSCVQLIGRPGADELLLSLGRVLESA